MKSSRINEWVNAAWRPKDGADSIVILDDLLGARFYSAMPKDKQPPVCPECGKPMRFVINKAMSGRSFKCLGCSGEDPIKLSDVSRWLKSELKPPK